MVDYCVLAIYAQLCEILRLEKFAIGNVTSSILYTQN